MNCLYTNFWSTSLGLNQNVLDHRTIEIYKHRVFELLLVSVTLYGNLQNSHVTCTRSSHVPPQIQSRCEYAHRRRCVCCLKPSPLCLYCSQPMLHVASKATTRYQVPDYKLKSTCKHLTSTHWTTTWSLSTLKLYVEWSMSR